MVVGVYGARNVVVPTAGTSTPSDWPTIARALTLEVLPWSVPMPSVV